MENDEAPGKWRNEITVRMISRTDDNEQAGGQSPTKYEGAEREISPKIHFKTDFGEISRLFPKSFPQNHENVV